jgi:hypothetical protein
MDSAEARASEFDDQGAHPWQRPQVRGIPLALGAGEQASAQLLQQRFVDGTLAPESALHPELLHRSSRPTAHRLPADLQSAGHLGLRDAFLQQLARGNPPILQRSRVDLLSDWHSHAVTLAGEMSIVTSLSKA